MARLRYLVKAGPLVTYSIHLYQSLGTLKVISDLRLDPYP